MKRILLTSLAVASLVAFSAQAWAPAGEKIMTRWGKAVTPENAWREYPRPQLKRAQWSNLNGLWNYAVTPISATEAPAQYEGEILVPFAIESALSGVGRHFSENDKLWYSTEFAIDPAWKGKEILLHFGAVDFEATVWVNGKQAGSHAGGFDPFTFDITKLLGAGGKQKLVVAVTDPTDKGSQARGKQRFDQKGIWYTPVSGIWQTVWIEPVSQTRIESVDPVANIDTKTITLNPSFTGVKAGDKITVNIYDATGKKIDGKEFTTGQSVSFQLKDMKLWDPTNPYLYKFDMTLTSGGKQTDKIDSYFAMRTISQGKDSFGTTRMMLNNKFLFNYGTLDQGWWPDGLHTPPSAAAMLYDMEVLKELGFNTLRKHIKIEPALYYHYADSLGLLVWQDMPSGFPTEEAKAAHIPQGGEKDWDRPAESAKQWEAELKEMIDDLRFFPSIVCWVVFNEGWGQYETERVVNWVVKYDPTRIVNGVSGWEDRKVGHMYDMHNYPYTSMFPRENIQNRIQVIGEFGGLGLPVKDHIWNPDMRNWGYRNLDEKEALLKDYTNLLGDLEPLVMGGLSGAIYTQTTDVEGEVNGLITYDREVVKLPVDEVRKATERLYSIVPSKATALIGDARTGNVLLPIAKGPVTENNKVYTQTKMPMETQVGETVSSIVKFNIDNMPKALSLNIGASGEVRAWINGKKVFEKTDLNHTRKLNQFNLTSYIKDLKQGENIFEIEYVNNKNGRKAGSPFEFNLISYE